jgi:hypothetical protein
LWTIPCRTAYNYAGVPYLHECISLLPFYLEDNLAPPCEVEITPFLITSPDIQKMPKMPCGPL